MKQIFTSLDFSGNFLSNFAIGSASSDPSGVEYGYIYRNSQTDRLRVYTEDGWEDLVRTPNGNIIQVVDSFDNLDGRGDTLYVKLRPGTQDKYDIYIYVNGTFFLINDPTVQWEDIVNVPDIMDCSYIASDEQLHLFYI